MYISPNGRKSPWAGFWRSQSYLWTLLRTIDFLIDVDNLCQGYTYTPKLSLDIRESWSQGRPHICHHRATIRVALLNIILQGFVHCNDRSLWLWMDNQVTHTSWIDTQPEMPFESNEKTTTRQILGSTVRWPFRAPLNLWMPLFFVYTAYNLQIMESVLLTSAVAKRRPCVFCQHLMAWTWLYQASSEVSCFLYT
jgi:hypothetical protein